MAAEDNRLLHPSFWFAYWIPCAVAVVLFALQFALRAGPADAWTWWSGLASAKDADALVRPQWWVLGAAAAVVTAGAVLLRAATAAMIQSFEGYRARAALKPFAALARRRFGRLRDRRKAARARGDAAAFARAQARLQNEFPRDASLLLPFRLGNILRAAELYPLDTYGVHGTFWWPRLWLVLPDGVRTAVTSELANLVGFLNLSLLVALAACASVAWPRAPRGAEWLAPAIGFGLAWACHRAALASALVYARRMRAAYDLHRFDLLRALHQPLPSNLAEERRLWATLLAWTYEGDLGPALALPYAHPAAPAAADETAPRTT